MDASVSRADRLMKWGLAALGALLFVPATSAAFGPSPSGPLSDQDVRSSGKPSPSLSLDAARERLDDRLGEQGFADAAQPLGTTGFVGRTDGFLTSHSDDSARQVALGYVSDHSAAFGLDAGDIDDLKLTDRYTSLDGVTHLTWSQMVSGVPSYDTFLRANVTKDGQLVNVSGGPVGDLSLNTTAPDLSARDALVAARENVGAAHPQAPADPLESAKLVAFAEGSDARLAWDVYADGADSLLYEVVVDAGSGRVLSRESRTDFLNQAAVWAAHPTDGVAPTTVNLGADPSWIDNTVGGTKLQGNNAHAYADTNANNIADAAEEVPQVAPPNGDWLYPITYSHQAECPAFACTWDSTNNATKLTNQKQTTTQLFYFVNKWHDHLLAPPISFNEASRNFQRVNSSGLGVGNDPVLAEANDGGGTNNANFSTTPDGTSGRMQMYFFNNNWDVTSSDDADVVYHEYTHGLTNRLVGNGAGLAAFQSGAMGEAWSDWYANDFQVAQGLKTDGPGIDLTLGAYSINLFGTGGIRREPMDCKVGSPAASCPGAGSTGSGGFTFGDLNKFPIVGGVHDNGEIWAQTLWDLRDAVGSARAEALVTGGLRLSPLNPSFLDMRDAILQSAITLGEPRGPIWQVFAARGMGFSASTPGATSYLATEAFDIPPALQHDHTDVADPPPLGDGDGVLEPGETVTVTPTLKELEPPPITNVAATMSTGASGVLLGNDHTTWPDFTAIGSTAVPDPPFSVTLPSTASCGGTVNLTFDVTTSSSSPSPIPTRALSIGTPSFQIANPAIAIPDNNPVGVNTTMNLPAGTVGNIDVKIAQLTHTYDGDLKLTLTSPTGTSKVLINRRGGTDNGFTNLVLDDGAAAPIASIPTDGATVSGTFRPEEPLSGFSGENAAGAWTMNVSDNASVDTGTLDSWGISPRLECSTSAPALPTALTKPASGIDLTAATLAGDVDPKGTATNYRFEYGPTTAYGTRTTTGDAGAGNGVVTQTATVTGLASATAYHYRVLALRAGTVIARGDDQPFTTTSAPVAAPPVVSLPDTPPATNPGDNACAKAKAKLKKAKAKLKKAKKKEVAKKIDKAKKKVKKAKKKKKKVC